MRALETHYNGFRFRSRTEARWAVFMDAMGVQYEYEAEAYELNGVSYLPDFWLPTLNAHLEIKPAAPSDDELEKLVRLVEHTGKKAFIIWGQPEMPFLGYDRSKYESAKVILSAVPFEWDHSYWWCQCPNCGKCDLQFNGRADRIDCICPKSSHGDKGYNYESRKLVSAYERARGWRFEPYASNAMI